MKNVVVYVAVNNNKKHKLKKEKGLLTSCLCKKKFNSFFKAYKKQRKIDTVGH